MKTTKKADAKFAHLYIKEVEGKMLVRKRNDKVIDAFMIGSIFDSEDFKGEYDLHAVAGYCQKCLYTITLRDLKKLADGEVLTNKTRQGDICTTYVKNINECTL